MVLLVFGLLGRRLGLVKLRFCVSFCTCFFGWVFGCFVAFSCELCPAGFPFFIFLVCCLAAMAGIRTVVVDLCDFRPNLDFF